LWNQFEFSNLFPQSNQKEVSTGQIAEILTLSKLLKLSSHVKTVDWIQESLLPEILNINSDKYNRMKIFNELSLIEESKFRIEKKLFEQAKKTQLMSLIYILLSKSSRNLLITHKFYSKLNPQMNF
jgi:hypothetical protein